MSNFNVEYKPTCYYCFTQYEKASGISIFGLDFCSTTCHSEYSGHECGVGYDEEQE